MPTASWTLGPLHLEDLEPHRFEDLLRQLLYDFREWRVLEATGRAGSDDGFDVRGWEIVAPEIDVLQEVEDEGTVAAARTDTDRLWLVQCKREKSIGPKKLLKYLDDIPTGERVGVYGIVFAAACDFSKQARDVFRNVCREYGFAELYLWGKAEIEDMLFQPKNDHLLFAYTGISLKTRRRSLKTDVRARLATKHKAKKVLQPYQEVLIRDASDGRYPFLEEDPKRSRIERGRWKVMKFGCAGHDGLRIIVGIYNGFLDTNNVNWDYAETDNRGDVHPDQDPWSEEGEEAGHHWRNARGTEWEIWNALPEQSRALYEVYKVLPYENILAIDEEGDECFREPHIYTITWYYDRGPFLSRTIKALRTVGVGFASRWANPLPETRISKFPRKA